MQRIHLIGASDIQTLSGDTVHAVFPESAETKYPFYKKRADRGEEVIYINGSRPLIGYTLDTILPHIGASRVLLGKQRGEHGAKNTERDVRKLTNKGYKVIILLHGIDVEEEYAEIVNQFPSSISIAIPCVPDKYKDGYGRFNAIRNLVHQNKWDLQREHYLWELENPAELIVYSKAFLFRVKSSIVGFFSERCYYDSMYGISYSPSMGLFCNLLNHHDTVTGYRHRQQFSLFSMNDETMKGFASGKLGYDLWEIFKKRSKEAGYEYD